MGEGRFLIWVFGAAAAILSLFLGREPAALERWSAAFIPAGNLCMVFVFLPLLYLAGRQQGQDGGAPSAPVSAPRS